MHCDAECNGGLKQYPNDTDLMCYNCDSLCRKCTGPASNECTGCYTGWHHRVIVGTECVCQDGFYDDLSNDICLDCHYSCKTCFGGGSSMCESCEPLDFRSNDGNNSCPCLAGYYDNSSDTCAECHYTCETCSGGNNANKCSSCDIAGNHRKMDTSTSRCNCMGIKMSIHLENI